MQKRLIIFLYLVFASVVTNAQARGVDIRLADEVAEFIYLTESSTFGYGGADLGVGFLYNEADDLMFSLAAMVTGHGAGNSRSLKFGVGIKGVAIQLEQLPEEDQMAAIAVGAQVRYVIPSSAPLAFLVEGYIAPSITSFNDAERYSEFRAAVELEVTPSARAYIGYRNIEVDLDGIRDIEIDDSVHIGVRLTF